MTCYVTFQFFLTSFASSERSLSASSVLPQVELHSASTMGASDTLSSAVVADASS
jgi:hypothetical protein